MRSGLALAFCGLSFAIAVPASAEEIVQDDLAGLSIEELAQIPVRSASKRDEPLSQAPTALYVITDDDIETSGAMLLPEVLRLAPNLQVQQVNASEYSISARGFNGAQAGNKLLALIDGRTIYTPLASSIFWNLHSPLLEDIGQIEVISGPGGTLYGPNAVNGVINVTTRSAQDTIGTLARGTAGPRERTAAVRHGFAIGTSGAIRFYGNWHDRDGLPAGIANDYDDDYRGWQAGFRSDFVSAADHVTVQGDVFRTRSDTIEGDGGKGHNLLARWSRTLGPESSFQVQAYYDWFKREFTLVDDSVQTFDAEAQFNATAGAHTFVAGAGVRTTRDEFINDLNIFQLNPMRRRLWVYNAFAQDHYELAPDLALIVGVKVERSTFTGWQVLPNLRIAWQPDERSLVWAALSRAVRTPSRIDRQLEAPPFLLAAQDFTLEKLVALEAGYRGQPSSKVSFSVNGFVNFYDDLRTTELVGPSFQLRNGAEGTTYGLEAWGTAQLAEWWRVSLGAAGLWKDLRDKDGHVDLAVRNSRGNDPEWQVLARSEFDLHPRLKLTVRGRAVGDIEQTPQIGSYVELGGQLAYQVTDEIELFAAGRNLLQRTHAESNDPGLGQLATRSIYLGTRLRF